VFGWRQERCPGPVEERVNCAQQTQLLPRVSNVPSKPCRPPVKAIHSSGLTDRYPGRTAAKVPTLAGTKLDKYEMLEEVGHGGMAVVYRGQDTVLRREVALKVLHAHLSDQVESRLRLQREAIAVAKLRHDNILEIFDYSGPDAPQSYIVTEFIHGPTLREWIETRFEPRPVIAILIVHRLCLALAHAHACGIIHRDIKPENVMIRMEDGCIKLMDFGIAQLLDNQKLTMTGQLIGSPAYMAPELVNGRPLDARTDLFSLGIMLYQLATGELPFCGRNPHEVLNRIADGDYPAPSSVSPLVDPDLEAIIDRSLATSPNERYQSVQTFAEDLSQYLAEVGIEPTTDELADYFHRTTEYTKELDARVATSLLGLADAAAKQGHTGKAIRYLGRVLEIDHAHPSARSMLTRLRRRERQIRQGLLAAGVLAAGGFVAAAYVLLEPNSARMNRTEPSTVSMFQANPDVGPSAEPPVLATQPEPILEVDDEPPSQLSVETSEQLAATPPSVEGNTEAGESADDPKPSAPNRRPRPPRTEDESTTPIRTPPTRYSCRVRLDGIPSSTAKNLHLRINNGPTLQVQDSLTDIEVEEKSGMASVAIKSPRYKGGVQLSFAACQAGPVRLLVEPQPAEVTFEGAPSNTVVKCISGCQPGYGGVHHANRMPDVEIPHDRPTHPVTFEVLPPCHEPTLITYALQPGSPNRIRVDLNKPLPPETCQP